MVEGDVTRSPRPQSGSEGDVIGAPDLMGGGNLVRWNEFVSCGEDGDARLFSDGERGRSDGGGDGRDSRGEERAGGDQFGSLIEIAASGMNVCSG